MTDEPNREPEHQPDREPDRDGGGRRRSDAHRWMSPDFLTELFSNPLDPGYADAAARRAERGPVTGWRHQSRRVAVIVVAGLIGVLLAVAYRQTVADEPRRSQARSDLVAQIKQRQEVTDDLRARADRLRDEVARERDAALGSGALSAQREVEAFTGLRRVTGDGVVVRLSDAPAADDGVTTNGPDLSRILDRDLQGVTNALWSAGAEAIAINGQRLSATSTIRKAGGAILVDFRPVTSPYEIRAIGPKDLEDRFKETGTAALMRRLVDDEGIGYEVKGAKNINLPAATEAELDYARKPEPPAGSTPMSATTGTPSAGAPRSAVPTPTVPTPTAASESPSGGGS